MHYASHETIRHVLAAVRLTADRVVRVGVQYREDSGDRAASWAERSGLQAEMDIV